MLHQLNNSKDSNNYNRYPEIFKICSDLIIESEPKILSFGCSFGQEIQTLKDLYFKSAIIDGVEINPDCIKYCREKFIDNKIFTYDEFTDSSIKHDIIFAMSVFCKWEDTKLIDDCSNIYPFSMFDKGVGILNDKLKQGGLLVVYNSNFCMSESSVYNLFEPITSNKINDSGFVHKFNKENKKIDIDYKDVIFKKIN